MQAGPAAVGAPPRSDGEGEFGEGSHQPQRRGFLNPEFVVATSDILHQAMSGDDDPGSAVGLQSTHRA
jgi:hypothetical protein